MKNKLLSINNLELPVNTFLILNRENILTLGDLSNFNDLTKCFNPKEIEEIKEELEKYGLDIKTGCQCYMCQNKDNLDRLHGYHTGYYEALKTVVKEMKAQGLRDGSIADINMNGVLARAECNMESAGEMLICIEEKLNEEQQS
jgi:hypothetical protein